MSVEEVAIDPDIMVAADRLAIQYMSGHCAGVQVP